MQFLKRHIITVAIVAITFLVVVTGTMSAVVRYYGWFGAPKPTPHVTTTRHSGNSLPLPDGQDWAQYRFDLSGTGMNPEGYISAKNVTQLTEQWTINPHLAFGSTPAIVNGVVYVPAGNSLFALDLITGERIWQFNGAPQTRGIISSSVAVDPGAHLAYYGTPDAHVYAVNTLTGTGVWNVQLGNPEAGAYIWSSPLLVNGKVYIGLASRNDNPCVRGGVFALDAATGKIAWMHYMVGAGALGGSVWSSLIANPGAHEVIATTGNPCLSSQSDEQQDSFVAMDWDTGTTHWQYTALEHDDCDCDFGQGPVDYTYHGQEYLVAGNKGGVVYAVTPLPGRHSVQLAWSLKIAKPGFLGYGGIFQPPTYSDGKVFIAGGPTPDGSCKQGALYALQADTGKVLWHLCTLGQVLSPTSTTGDVLFVEQGGVLIAYESATGRELWRAEQHSDFWGGVSISRGYVLIGSVSGTLYSYYFPEMPKHLPS